MNEISFRKYETRGPNYHWEQISKSLRKRNTYVVARYELLLDLIDEEINGKKFLDVGCGDGVLSCLLAKKGAEVNGVDNSEEAIKFAKERARDFERLELLVSSAYELPFKDEGFDYVVSSELMEHLKYPERMLAEIRRVWNRKGKIFITTPTRFTEQPVDSMHHKEFFEGELRELLERYFEEVRIVESHPLFWAELQNKHIFGRLLPKFFLNCLDILFGFCPFKNTRDWRYYTLQTAIISK